jgi:hypothetical protein
MMMDTNALRQRSSRPQGGEVPAKFGTSDVQDLEWFCFTVPLLECGTYIIMSYK